MKFTEYRGTTTLLGREREVAFTTSTSYPMTGEPKQTSSLSIEVDNAGEAEAILAVLAKAHVSLAPPVPAPVKAAEKAAKVDKPEKTAPVVAAAAVPPPAEDPDEIDEVPAAAVAGDDDAEKAALAKAAKADRGSVMYRGLMDAGYNTTEKLLAFCKKHQAKLPLLANVAGLEERVERAIKVLSGPAPVAVASA